jgi:hypothetical protein
VTGTHPNTTIRTLRASDKADWLTLWAGYNAFYGRAGETALEAASAAGAVSLYWHTQEANQPARRLYDQFTEVSGFVVYRLKP